jgi:hypothetical protein
MDKILISKNNRTLIRPAVYDSFFRSHGWTLIAIGTADTIYEIAKATL